jgi:hypothetical protein
LQDPIEFEIACQVVACVVRRERATDDGVAGALVVTKSTVTKHQGKVWPAVLRRFPDLGQRRGRGRTSIRTRMNELGVALSVAADLELSDAGRDGRVFR